MCKHSLVTSLVLAFLIITSGCASRIPEDSSFALTVINELDPELRKGLRDTSVPEYIDPSAAIKFDAALYGAQSIGYATNLLTAPIGSQGFASTLMLLSLLDTNEYPSMRASLVFNWTPIAENVENLEDYQHIQIAFLHRVRELAVASLLELYPDYQFRQESVPSKAERKKHHLWVGFYRVNGPLCEEWSCYLFAGVLEDDTYDGKLLISSHFKRNPVVSTPDFVVNPMGYERSVIIGTLLVFSRKSSFENIFYRGITDVPFRHPRGEAVEGFDYSAFWEVFSSRLSSNDFVYIGPKSIGNKSEIPFVINRNQVHLFVK